MKVGDLVRCASWLGQTGIVVEVGDPDPETVPPVVTVLWDSGALGKEWTDELEVIND